MLAGEVDWARLLVYSLDKSPLVLQSTFCKVALRSNSWQCHILSCMLTCLVPRVRAEIADFLTCSSHNELEQDSCVIVQAASEKVVHALQQAESFVQACHHEDAASLIVSTACTGEVLTVHVHDLFWSISGLILATRVALGFPDEKLSMYIQQQVSCWSDNISRYIGLGAELLDLKELASMVTTDLVSGVNHKLLFDNALVQTPAVTSILSYRLKWVMCKDHMRESQMDSLLEEIKIDYNDMVFDNKTATDEENRDMRIYARARWAGMPVSITWCHLSALSDTTAMLLRMRNPFILQLIGWTEATEVDQGLSCCMVMEDVNTDLESFIKERKELKAAEYMEDGLLFSFSEALDMMLQIARGMWYLHRNGIAHKGLRSRNVWLRTEVDSGAMRLKLCNIRLPSPVEMSEVSDYADDVLSFGMLCGEILTGRETCDNGAGVFEMQLPASTPVLLSDCLKACGDPSVPNRPEFGVICGLLRHLKLIVASPHHLERLLYFNEAAKASSKHSVLESAPLHVKGTTKSIPDDMAIRIQLIDINVALLHASSPPELYSLVASESYLAKVPVSLRMLEDMSNQFRQGHQFHGTQDSSLISPSTSNAVQLKFVISNASTLKTSLVVDGFQGLLKSGWASTTLGLGTLELWLQFLSPKWKDVQKLALGMALCLRQVSKTPPKFGFYSHEQGNIDGFYPIFPGNILLNNQLKVGLLLDNSLSAWKSLIEWAGVHPQVGEGVDNILISIEAYTTYYFGHLLSSILKVRNSNKVEWATTASTTASYSDHHHEFVLTNLSMRCIQLKYLSMTEVVTILLNDHKVHSAPLSPFRE